MPGLDRSLRYGEMLGGGRAAARIMTNNQRGDDERAERRAAAALLRLNRARQASGTSPGADPPPRGAVELQRRRVSLNELNHRRVDLRQRGGYLRPTGRVAERREALLRN